MDHIDDLLAMRSYFDSGISKSFAFRKLQLTKLREAIIKFEKPLYEALYTDLKKNPEECWVTENGFVIAEINNTLKKLKHWMMPSSVSTNLLNLPSKSYIISDPLGVVLIIGPWNYPLNNLFTPLVGAIAAGNCVILKPSEFAPAAAAVMQQLIDETFDKQYVKLIQGDGAVVIPEIMNNFRFDHLFYTGGGLVGKKVYKMAAERLVPVTLELGGKSPCVVEADANINVAARRIALSKYSNAGQMCVAPDYILVQESVKDELIAALIKTIQQFFGERPDESYNYCKIINLKQFNRLAEYLHQGKIVFGGQLDAAKLYIMPTILDNVDLDSPIMKEEIFGPILPVIGFTTAQEAKEIILKNPNPLAFYVFTSSSRKEKEWIGKFPFGGGCINNASWHLTNHHLPFGGRGFSGSGKYHGKYSFDTFTHKKAIMKTPTWFDPAIKYPPFKGKLKLFKMVIR